MVCPHGQGRLSQWRHFADKGEGLIFRNFVRMSFIYGPKVFFSTNYYLIMVGNVCVPPRPVLAKDKNLLLGLPMPGRSADGGHTKCNST